MTNEQQYIERAIEELKYPTFELTKQHIEVLELQTKNGLPEVARVSETDSDVSVYFRIKAERFFLVINLSKKPIIEPFFTWVESGHRVYLTATSEKYSFDELKNYLTLRPLTGWSKGDLRANKNSVYNFSRISFEPIKNEAYDLDEKLPKLLSEIEKDRKGILKLVSNSEANISVCKNQYVSGNAGIHFDIETIDRLQKLNLPIDIDMYIGGNELND